MTAVEEQLDVVTPTVAESRRPGFLVRYRLWILLLITVAGGVARFATLERPPLWGDEAFTYYRTSGTFQELLDILQFNGFPPLHYEAYWKLGQWHKLTPAVMRLIPTTAGTLMIPAMYFLAVQIVRRRVALLVALFTACSAYMMVYSHDAKMYMACWLFVALHVGCLLWWLRVGRSAVGRIAWLAWVACGLAAVGFHHSANVLLPVELIVLLTFPRLPESPAIGRRLLLFVLGAAVILAGPAGYFLGFNRIAEKVDEQGYAMGSETYWVEGYNLGRGPADLVLYTATAHLYSWEWPLKPEHLLIDADVLHGLVAAGVAILLLIAAGSLPWRHRIRREPSGSAAGPLASSGLLVIDDPPPQAWWRTFLWIGAWIVPIGYGWYCASTKHFASPLDAVNALGHLFGGHWIALLLEIVALAAVSHAWPSLPRYLAAAIPIVALLGLYGALLNAGIEHPWRGSEWHAHYWPVLTEWWAWVSAPRFVLMLVGVLPVVAWHYAADRPRGRALRFAQFVVIVAVLYALCWAAWFLFTRRADVLAHRIAQERGINVAAATDIVWAQWLSAWMPRYLGILWPAVAISACTLLARLPTRPLRYAAVTLLLGLNVAQATARLTVGTEPPSNLIAHDIAASQDGPGHPADRRTYLFGFSEMAMPSPGSLSFLTWQMRYYLSQVSQAQITPHEFKYSPLAVPSMAKVWQLKFWNDLRPLAAAADANGSPQLQHVIVWERLRQYGDATGAAAEFPQKLGPAWRLASDRTFVGRDHWTWNNLWFLRRRDYVRTAGVTGPATRP